MQAKGFRLEIAATTRINRDSGVFLFLLMTLNNPVGRRTAASDQ